MPGEPENGGGNKPLHQADCLVGAVSAGFGARLATGNAAQDFPMREVTVEEWPPGS
ncbi:MAG: hypothetical protein ACRDRM_08650 [Pseudonocardiaceae bacterium]